MKIVAISDTHMCHTQIKLPEGDVLVHAGDATFLGKPTELIRFNQWLLEYQTRFKHIIFVPGNHDMLFESHPGVARTLLTAAKVLIDQELVIDGVKFWGSPWQPEFNDWAFGLMRGSEKMKEKWNQIPTDTDVLITHGAPYGFFDRNLGDLDLARQVGNIRPKFHAFGHIHRDLDMPKREITLMDGVGRATTFANVSMMNEEYQILDDPFVFEVSPQERNSENVGNR